jgi:FkbM family methyltransferase
MKRRRHSWLADLALGGLMVSAVGGILWYRSQDPDLHRLELDAYRRAYGRAKASRGGEEWFVRDFFRDRRGGVFVDVGASHYQRDSNTYFLETALGWSGIAVDANAEFAAEYATHRPRTRFVTFFVADRSDAEATLYVPRRGSVMASGDRAFAGLSRRELSELRVPTITLTDLLDAAGITSFDFLSMDIELAEPTALAGFDIGRFKPTLVCVEGHRDVRQAILDYFTRAGYVIVGDYLRADQWNLWFTPLPAAPLTPEPAPAPGPP